MALDQDFASASEEVKKLSERPDNDTLLSLYALYKQATDGDVEGARPGMLDIKGRKKYDAWAEKKGMTAERAKQNYIALVKQLSRG